MKHRVWFSFNMFRINQHNFRLTLDKKKKNHAHFFVYIDVVLCTVDIYRVHRKIKKNSFFMRRVHSFVFRRRKASPHALHM